MIDLTEYLDTRGIVLREERGSDGSPQLVCECPFCGRPKLYVNGGEGERAGLWICYRCDERGNAVKLVMELDGVERFEAKLVVKGIRDARPLSTVEDYLRRREATSEPLPAEPEALVLPEGFEPVYGGPRPGIHPYLTRRGISPKLAGAYGLGFCATGRYRDRILIPAYDEDGVLLTYQCRSVVGAEPKYLAADVPRGRYLLGLHRIVGAERVALVEGPFDVLGCARAGVPAVAVLGKVITDAHVDVLQGLGVRDVVVMFDPEAKEQAAKQARSRFVDAFRPALAPLPEGDPGDQPADVIREAFAAPVAVTRFGRYAAS